MSQDNDETYFEQEFNNAHTEKIRKKFPNDTENGLYETDHLTGNAELGTQMTPHLSSSESDADDEYFGYEEIPAEAVQRLRKELFPNSQKKIPMDTMNGVCSFPYDTANIENICTDSFAQKNKIQTETNIVIPIEKIISKNERKKKENRTKKLDIAVIENEDVLKVKSKKLTSNQTKKRNTAVEQNDDAPKVKVPKSIKENKENCIADLYRKKIDKRAGAAKQLANNEDVNREHSSKGDSSKFNAFRQQLALRKSLNDVNSKFLPSLVSVKAPVYRNGLNGGQHKKPEKNSSQQSLLSLKQAVDRNGPNGGINKKLAKNLGEPSTFKIHQQQPAKKSLNNNNTQSSLRLHLTSPFEDLMENGIGVPRSQHKKLPTKSPKNPSSINQHQGMRVDISQHEHSHREQMQQRSSNLPLSPVIHVQQYLYESPNPPTGSQQQQVNVTTSQHEGVPRRSANFSLSPGIQEQPLPYKSPNPIGSQQQQVSVTTPQHQQAPRRSSNLPLSLVIQVQQLQRTSPNDDFEFLHPLSNSSPIVGTPNGNVQLQQLPLQLHRLAEYVVEVKKFQIQILKEQKVIKDQLETIMPTINLPNVDEFHSKCEEDLTNVERKLRDNKALQKSLAEELRKSFMGKNVSSKHSSHHGHII